MEQHSEPERAAKIIDRKGHAASQGVFSGEAFDHLIGKHIELEKESPEARELVLGEIFDSYWQMFKPSPRLLTNPTEIIMREFNHLMFIALAQASYSREIGEMKLAGQVDGMFAEGYSFLRIFSHPEIKGIRINIQEPGKMISHIDLTKDKLFIQIKRPWEEKFKNASLAEFLGYEYDPHDPRIEELISTGRELDQKIFGKLKAKRVGAKLIENG